MTEKLSLAKDKIRIVLFEGIHPNAVEVFKSHGYTSVELLPNALTGDALKEKIQDAHMIGIRSRTQITEEVLSSTRRLMAIGCFCIGTNQVNLEKAADLGVPVFNAPHSNTRSVAELVIGQTIMLMRGIFPKSAAAHRGSWTKSAKGSNEVRGKTLGIVGYGHIGSQVSVLAEAMGMRVLFYDIQSKLPMGNAVRAKSMEQLLKESDVVTLHVPADPSTVNMITAKEIGQMKKGSFLINASRGTVVEIPDFAAALKEGHLAGGAVDVFPVEPKSNQLPFESALIGLEQVILTPHIGGSTQEAQENIGIEVANKLAFFSDCGTTDGSVNFPKVNLPLVEGAHRVLHIHRNAPGVLRQINDTMADANVNVVGQYLATHGGLGYVVLDVTVGMTDQLLAPLKQIPGTIRTRVLY